MSWKSHGTGNRRVGKLWRNPVALALATVLSTVLLLGLPAEAQNQWTQWRGPGRDGSVAAAAPQSWPKKLTLLWEREVGAGYSGPIVSGNRIWIHSRKNGKEIVSSLALDEGKTVWSGYYEAPFTQDTDGQPHGLGPYSTPSLADGRLFTLGVTTILSVWDAERGELLWRKDYSDEFEFSFAYFGTSASPLVWEGLCFVHFGGHERGHITAGGVGDFIALRVHDGTEAWRWSGDAPAAGASPVIEMIEGQPHLIFKTLNNILGLEPRAGTELWRIPFKVPMVNTISTPVVVGNRLVTSDYQMGFLAWQIESQQGAWTVRELWENPRPYLFCSSPVAVEGQVVGFSLTRSGELVGLDLNDGKILWRGDPRWGEHATLISWGEFLLVFKEDGSLVVGKVSKSGFEEIQRYSLGSSLMWGHPAVIENRIIIRDGNRLAVYGVGQASLPVIKSVQEPETTGYWRRGGPLCPPEMRRIRKRTDTRVLHDLLPEGPFFDCDSDRETRPRF